MEGGGKLNENFLKTLKDEFGIVFQNISLLEQAFTHSSYVNEHRGSRLNDNERIEFLGDAVLELTISRYLFEHYPEMSEGKLTRFRATIVCEASFSQFAKELGFDKEIRLGRGEEQMNGRKRSALLCDLFESFVGALYLDQGLDAVLDFLKQFVFPKIKAGAFSHVMDYKTQLQEWLQKNGEVLIQYQILEEVGPAHEKEFVVAVVADGKQLATGSGKTKKAAEQAAAETALKNEKVL